jgi:hypothetical protein
MERTNRGYCSRIFLQGLNKTTNNLSQYIAGFLTKISSVNLRNTKQQRLQIAVSSLTFLWPKYCTQFALLLFFIIVINIIIINNEIIIIAVIPTSRSGSLSSQIPKDSPTNLCMHILFPPSWLQDQPTTTPNCHYRKHSELPV